LLSSPCAGLRDNEGGRLVAKVTYHRQSTSIPAI
jgi:hypothetical protein